MLIFASATSYGLPTNYWDKHVSDGGWHAGPDPDMIIGDGNNGRTARGVLAHTMGVPSYGADIVDKELRRESTTKNVHVHGCVAH